MAGCLTASGHAVMLQEFVGGHDWLCWREGLLEGLALLLPTMQVDHFPETFPEPNHCMRAR